MVNHVKLAKSQEFIIGTEKEIGHRLRKENPTKEFYTIDKAVCPNMKKITLTHVLNSLKSLSPEIQLEAEVIEKAKIPLQKMLIAGRGD